MESIMKLESLITEMTEIVTSTNEVEFNLKLAPDKWSKKEILGHLCDSAVNNHIRFVKILLSDYPIAISGYTQNDWVRVNDYQDQYDQSEVLSLWRFEPDDSACHAQSRFIRFSEKCVADKTEVTLEWLFDDYVDHMIHHLEQIEL